MCAHCLFTFIDVENRSWMFLLILWIIEYRLTYLWKWSMSHKSHITKRNTFDKLLFCFPYWFVWKMVNLRLSFFWVFNSSFNILNTLSQFSLKIAMHYQKTLFYFIPKYFLIRNTCFQEIAKTKVYALEDALGVLLNLTSLPLACQTAWILIRLDILSGLIWIQTVCQ